jgi:hypothetical protein
MSDPDSTGNSVNVASGRPRPASAKQWPAVLVKTLIGVIAALGAYLMIDTQRTEAAFRRHAEQSLDTAAQVVEEWVMGKVDAFTREPCACPVAVPKRSPLEGGAAVGVRCESREPPKEVPPVPPAVTIKLEGNRLVVEPSGKVRCPFDWGVTHQSRASLSIEVSELKWELEVQRQDSSVLSGLVLYDGETEILRTGTITSEFELESAKERGAAAVESPDLGFLADLARIGQSHSGHVAARTIRLDGAVRILSERKVGCRRNCDRYGRTRTSTKRACRPRWRRRCRVREMSCIGSD